MQKKTQKEGSLGQRIRQLRREREWTQEQLAEAIEAHVQTVGLYEKGTLPTALVLKRIADAFGVSMEYLVSGETNNTVTIKSKDLLKRIDQLQRLNPHSLKSLMDVMDVYIRDQQVKELARAS
ncbi:helix-turn-helix transcriptional regulator [bacterium]|nr:helix-turn-helix transcriptional regulator [bacterium]